MSGLMRAAKWAGRRAAITWLVVVAVAAVTAPWLPLDDPNATDPCTTGGNQLYRGVPIEDVRVTDACPTPTVDARTGAFPSARHLLGTDELGRDILSRLVFGARVSLFVAAFAVTLALMVGGGIGLVAGYYRGRPSALLMAAMDVVLAFPALVLALGIISFAGQSALVVAIALGVVGTPAFARVSRATTLTWSQREFVTAATVLGDSRWRVLWREVAPNAAGPLLAFALVSLGVAVVAEGSLAFLGLSVPAPTASWGGMIAGGRGLLDTSPHVSLIPTAVLFVTLLAVNVLGERLRRHRPAAVPARRARADHTVSPAGSSAAGEGG